MATIRKEQILQQLEIIKIPSRMEKRKRGIDYKCLLYFCPPDSDSFLFEETQSSIAQNDQTLTPMQVLATSAQPACNIEDDNSDKALKEEKFHSSGDEGTGLKEQKPYDQTYKKDPIKEEIKKSETDNCGK